MRLNIGTLLVGVFAILFGLIGAYALRSVLTPAPQPVAAAPRTVSVPLASNELPVGRKLVLSDMVLNPMTPEQMKEKGYPLNELMLSTDQIIGRVLAKPMKQGDAFLTSNLFREGEAPTVESKLAPGFRAFTIPMDDLNAVGGAAAPGQNVDVIFRLGPQPGDPWRRVPPMAETTVTLIENIEVLSVNREVYVQPQGQGLDVRTNVNRRPQPVVGPIRSVTLAVTPDQANILKTASGRGEMTLRLRNLNDAVSKQTLGPLTMEKLVSVKGADAPDGKVKRPSRMEIYRAGGIQVLPYDDDNYFPGTGGVNGGTVTVNNAYNGFGWGGGWGGAWGGMGGYNGTNWGLGAAGGWGGGWGGAGGYGGGWGGQWGSQANGGGLHHYGPNYSPLNNYNNGYNWGGGWGGVGANPTNTILPYPGLPPRAANPDSMYQPGQPGHGPMNPNGPQPGPQNAGNGVQMVPVAVNWTMPYGNSFAYVGPNYAYPFAPPYIPTVNGQ